LIVFKNISVFNFRLAAFLSRFTEVKYFKFSLDRKKKNILININKNNIYQIDNTKKNKINDFSIYFNDQKNIIKNHLKIFTTRKIFLSISDLIKKKFSTNIILKMFVYEKIAEAYISYYTPLKYWSLTFSKTKKIYYLSFDFVDIFLPKIENVTKVIIPINIIPLFKFIFRKLTFKKKIKKTNIDKNNYTYKVGFLVHKSIQYSNLYQKDYFYSKQKKSSFYKSNILHFFYSIQLLERNFNNFILLKSQNSLKQFFKYFIKNVIYIRSFMDIYVLFSYLKFIIDTEHYIKVLKKYKSLKLFIIDNENQAPKPFLLALKKLKIKIISTEERTLSKYNFPLSFMGDIYFGSSKYFYKKNFFKVNKIIPVGYPRTDQMIKYKSNGNFVLILGLLGDRNYCNHKNEIIINWEEQLYFINQIINLCNSNKRENFVLMYKNFDWIKNTYFKDIRKKILKTKNLTINMEPFSTYKLAQKSKLIISYYSTVVEEMIFARKPVLVFDYSRNINYIFKKSIRNGTIPFIFCNNFNELQNKFQRVVYNKKFRINLLNNLRRFMKQPKTTFKTKEILLENLENLL
tara:strand:- start:18316 stop:20034 length:1719 start_codon:yes stop_codon:yes gene_type:complete